MRHVTLATDFSMTANRAIPQALWLARSLRVPLRLIHVREAHEATAPEPWMDALSDTMDARLEATVEQLGDQNVDAEERFGDPAQAILNELTEDSVALVIGSRQRGWLGRLMHRNLTNRLVRHSPVPVLVVGEYAHGVGAKPTAIVPVELTDLDAVAVPMAVAMAERLDVRVQLVHVVGAPLHAATLSASTSGEAVLLAAEQRAADEAARQRLRQLLHERVPEHRRAGFRVRAGATAEQICRSAEEASARIVILPTHDHFQWEQWKQWKRRLWGSTAEQVVRSAHTPVMVLHPQVRDAA